MSSVWHNSWSTLQTQGSTLNNILNLWSKTPKKGGTHKEWPCMISKSEIKKTPLLYEKYVFFYIHVAKSHGAFKTFYQYYQ